MKKLMKMISDRRASKAAACLARREHELRIYDTAQCDFDAILSKLN